MRVALDNNVLVALVDGRPGSANAARLKGLLGEVDAKKGELIIPAPVVAEFLSHHWAKREQMLTLLLNHGRVRVAQFDHLAALECADMERRARTSGDKRHPQSTDKAWQAVKIDRQIVAIAKTRSAVLVSNDPDVHRQASYIGVAVKRLDALDIPESERQLSLVEPSSPAVTRGTLPSRQGAALEGIRTSIEPRNLDP